MPPIEHGQYLLDYAFEIGPSKSTGQGPAVIDWVDIKALEEDTNFLATVKVNYGIDLRNIAEKEIKNLKKRTPKDEL